MSARRFGETDSAFIARQRAEAEAAAQSAAAAADEEATLQRIADKVTPPKDGIDGKDGRDGIDGKDGLPGRDGRDGVDGKDGRDGTNGRDGTDGRDGTNGRDGDKGDKGDPGLRGFPGRQGEPGETGLLPAKGEPFTQPIYNSEGDLTLAPLPNLGNSGMGSGGGAVGKDGAPGAPGAQGPAGLGVPAGGSTGQALTKVSAADNNTQWETVSKPGHSHAEGDTTSLVADLAGKSAVGHGHAEADVTSLTTDLAGKAASVHTHAEGDTTNLVTDLAAKSAVGHTHTHAATTGQTTDDHHAKAHVHLADGSGTVAHSSVSGITATDHHAAPGAGPESDDVIDAAGAAGTAGTFSRNLHGHKVNTTAGPGAVSTIDAAGAAGATGALARAGHGHEVDTTAGPGAIATIDAAGAAGATGAVARAGHGHEVDTSASLPLALGAAAAGATGAIARSQHVHPTTGLSLTGHGAADHADITRKFLLPAVDAGLDVATLVTLGASPNLIKAVAYADAATNGAYWAFEVPADWASGVITIQPVWSPGSTDATAHTVRWSMTCKTVAAGVTITAAGTNVLFTGASAARTLAVIVYDTATSTTLTPAAAGDLFTIELQRIGADAADTYVGVVNLLGVIVSYTANQ